MTENYIFMYAIDLIALLFLGVLLYKNNSQATHRKKEFLYAIGLTVLIILSEIGTIVTEGGALELRSLHILFNVIGFALTPIIPIVLMAIFDTKIFQNNIFLLLPTMLNIITVILSPFFGWIFYVDINNYYERGNIFFVFVIIYIINIIFLLTHTLHTCRKTFYPIMWKIVSLFIFTVAGTCIQLLVPSVHSSWHCVSLSLFLFYVLLSEFDSSIDILTGLYNRAAFEKATRGLTSRKAFSLIILDINNFKEVNDTYGHEYGDSVLKEVAEIIRNSFNSHIRSYRIGGDEFCIISKDTKRENLEYQLKTMTNNLSKERVNDIYLPTVSYGFSIFQGDKSLDFHKIFKEADDQMYYYKQLKKQKNI